MNMNKGIAKRQVKPFLKTTAKMTMMTMTTIISKNIMQPQKVMTVIAAATMMLKMIKICQLSLFAQFDEALKWRLY